MHFASAAHFEGVCALCLIHSERHVFEKLFEESFAKVARCDVLAFLARKRTVVDREVHFNRRFADLDERHGIYLLRRANGVADRYILDAAETHDVAHHCALDRHSFEPFDLEQVDDLALVWRDAAVIVAHDNFFCHIHFAALDTADADTSDVLVVVDCAHKQLKIAVFVAFGSGDIVDYCVKKRFEIHAGHVIITGCRRLLAAAIQDGALELFVACVKVEKKFEHFVAHFVKTRVRLVDLVDDDDDFKSQSKCFFNDETSLRHRAFLCVNQKHNAVDHLEHALHFAREIGVSGGVDDVYLRAVVVYGRVFCENGDAPFSFYIARVHDASCHLLIFSERTRLFEHAVHERCFAVVDVSDDCNVSQIVSNHN